MAFLRYIASDRPTWRPVRALDGPRESTVSEISPISASWSHASARQDCVREWTVRAVDGVSTRARSTAVRAGGVHGMPRNDDGIADRHHGLVHDGCLRVAEHATAGWYHDVDVVEATTPNPSNAAAV